MALNPALRKMVAKAKAKYEPELYASERKFQTREFLLNSIGNQLERIHATPAEKLFDCKKEATKLLEEIEMWTEGFDPNGRLIFTDPIESVESLPDR